MQMMMILSSWFLFLATWKCLSLFPWCLLSPPSSLAQKFFSQQSRLRQNQGDMEHLIHHSTYSFIILGQLKNVRVDQTKLI